MKSIIIWSSYVLALISLYLIFFYTKIEHITVMLWGGVFLVSIILDLYDLLNHKKRNKINGGILTISCMLTILFCFVNYEVFYHNIFFVLTVVIGVITLIYKIISFILYEILQQINWISLNDDIKTWKIFLGAFLVCFILYVLHFFIAAYPGYLSPDSVDQVKQVLKGEYYNHHPVYHTFIIGFCIKVGYFFSKSYSVGIATYVICQIAFISLSTACMFLTFFQMGFNKKKLFVIYFAYILMPNFVNYSSVIWKDIPFASFVTIYVCTLLRIIRKVGNDRINYIFLFLSGIGFCLFRRNGYPAFLFVTLLFLVIFWKKEKKIIIVTLITFLIASFMRGPVLKILNIKSGYINAYDIPVQMIGRTVSDGKYLTKEQIDLINNCINIDYINENYNPDLARTILFSIDFEYVEEHKRDYFILWIDLGKKYPNTYFKAWMDQIRGYLSPGYVGGEGYEYPIMGILENEYGIIPDPSSKQFVKLDDEYVQIISDNPILHFLEDIGFQFWLVLISFTYFIRKKDKIFAIYIPIIAIMLTLCLATPICNSYRYSYMLFVSMPLFLLPCLIAIGNNKSNNSLIDK